MRRFVPLLSLLLAACSTAALPTQPNDREWNELVAAWHRLEASRRAQPQPPAGASRGLVIETNLENQKRLAAETDRFAGRALEYHRRTGDPRAARLLANEKLRMGDTYTVILSRHERALELYREALALDPSLEEAKTRIALAESKRFVSMDGFAAIRDGTSEAEVAARIGVPREDWIKHLREDTRLYTVWIYLRPDGGAAAVYFEDGIVYHTNWNAAPPPGQAPQ